MSTSSDHPLHNLPAGQIEAALGAATRFLARWDDAFTVTNREELGQDAVVLALMRWSTLRDKGRFHAFVRDGRGHPMLGQQGPFVHGPLTVTHGPTARKHHQKQADHNHQRTLPRSE